MQDGPPYNRDRQQHRQQMQAFLQTHFPGHSWEFSLPGGSGSETYLDDLCKHPIYKVNSACGRNSSIVYYCRHPAYRKLKWGQWQIREIDKRKGKDGRGIVTSITCPKCGNLNPETRLYCVVCGESLMNVRLVTVRAL